MVATAASMPRLRPTGIGAGRDGAQALVHHRLGQHGGGRGAVTGDVVGLGGDLLGELCAEVLERVVELDLTGDGHTVVGDGGRTPLLVEDDVAALGAERDLDGVRERVDTALERATGVLVELQDLWHCGGFPSWQRPGSPCGDRGAALVARVPAGTGRRPQRPAWTW
jgi:hypothetical protein